MELALDKDLQDLLNQAKQTCPNLEIVVDRTRIKNKANIYKDVERYTITGNKHLFVTNNKQEVVKYLNNLLTSTPMANPTPFNSLVADTAQLQDKLKELKDFFPEARVEPTTGKHVSLFLDGKNQIFNSKVLNVLVFMHGVHCTCLHLNIEPHVEQVTNSNELNKIFAKAKKLIPKLSLCDDSYKGEDNFGGEEDHYNLSKDDKSIMVANSYDMVHYLDALILGYNLALQAS